MKHRRCLLTVVLTTGALLFAVYAYISFVWLTPAYAVETVIVEDSPMQCLAWSQRETRQSFGIKHARALVCFDFNVYGARLPATGAILKKKGVKCTVSGFYEFGAKSREDDCLWLEYCHYVATAGCGE